MDGIFVADACALIAFMAEAPMSPAMRAVMETGDVAVSPVSVWEITHKATAGKLPMQWAPGRLEDLLARQGFTQIPLTWEDAERATALPPIHKDPMDRMLIAQALRIGAVIVTSDRLFELYGVKTVW
jgi:PIN domain nuclease of toxin-antitoxin system